MQHRQLCISFKHVMFYCVLYKETKLNPNLSDPTVLHVVCCQYVRGFFLKLMLQYLHRSGDCFSRQLPQCSVLWVRSQVIVNTQSNIQYTILLCMFIYISISLLESFEFPMWVLQNCRQQCHPRLSGVVETEVQLSQVARLGVQSRGQKHTTFLCDLTA